VKHNQTTIRSAKAADASAAAAFIERFEAIPEEKWCTLKFLNDSGQRCAMGHVSETDDDGKLCGFREPANQLLELMRRHFAVPENCGEPVFKINDGQHPDFPNTDGSTPRSRILKALRQIAAKEQA
jgi:hypothetical protein